MGMITTDYLLATGIHQDQFPERKDIICFRFPVFEYVGEERYVKFEILAIPPNNYSVRMPEFDYIKNEVGPCVEYNLDQLLCFLLAYDKKQCYEFMKQLYIHVGIDNERIESILHRIPIFKEFSNQKEA